MAIPFLHNINLDDNQLLNAKLHVTSSAPTAAKGQIYLDSTLNKLRYHDGSGFVDADATTSGSFNTTSGVITFTKSSGDTFTVDIDGKYIESVVGGTYITESVTGQTVTLNHDNTSRSDTTSTDAPAYGGTFEAVTSVTTNATGHVTAIDVSTVTIPQNDSVDVSSTTSGTYYPTFVTGTGDVALNIDGGASDKLSYNAATQTLTVKNLVVPGTQTIQNETIQVVQDNTIRFEGSTADDFETDLTVVDPTADRTISLPDESGTVVLNAFKTITADSGTDAVADSDTDTLTITGGNAIETEGNSSTDTITINHTDTSSQASVNNSGNNFIQDVTLDTYGHVTGLGSGSVAHTLSTSSSGTADSIDLDLGQPDGTDDIVVVTGGTGIDVTLNSSSQFTISATSSFNEFAVDLDAAESSVTKATNTYTVTHSLNSRDVMVEVYHTTNYDTVFVDITRATVNTITVAFASSVTDGDYRVLIKKIG